MGYISTALADGATSLWSFGDTSGTTALDETSNHADGTYHDDGSGGFLLNQAGIPGGDGKSAAKFVAAHAGYADFGNSVPLKLAGVDFSVEYWIKLSSWAGTAMIVATWGPNFPEYWLDSSGHPFLASGNAGTSYALSSQAFTDTTTWHHVTFTHTTSDGLSKVYVDGIDRTGTPAQSVQHWSTDMNHAIWVGRDWNFTHYTDATLAMFAVYKSVALDSTKVASHYALGTPTVVSKTMGARTG